MKLNMFQKTKLDCLCLGVVIITTGDRNSLYFSESQTKPSVFDFHVSFNKESIDDSYSNNICRPSCHRFTSY